MMEESLIPNLEDFAHCSSMVELPNGNIMVSFYAGSAEANDDTKIYASIYDMGKNKWDQPHVLLNIKGKSQGNAVLFLNKKGRLYLFNNTIHKEWRRVPRLWNWALTDNMYMFSDDLGKTWSRNRPLFPDKIGWNFKNKAIYLQDNTVLFSMYDDYEFKSYILLSHDDGETWEYSQQIESEPNPIGIKDYFLKLIDKLIPMYGNIQPTLIERENGEILALLRPKNFHRILKSVSKDGGKTWTKTKEMTLKNPQSGIDAVKLANGNIVLAYNDATDTRGVLNLAISEDEGNTWHSKKIVEREAKKEFSYPAIIQSSDGLIHLTYTYKRDCIKYRKFDNSWIYR